jgi:hypothetical protein
VALVAEGLFLAGALDLFGETLDGALVFVAAGLFVEVAIKLRYHPASSVEHWASNRYMKIVRWSVAADFRPGRGVLPVRGFWLR